MWSLRTFFKTLTANGKYSLLNKDNLTQRIQMQLSKKQNFIVNFSVDFWNLDFKIEHFEKKDDP